MFTTIVPLRNLDIFTIVGYILVLFIVFFITEEQESLTSLCILSTFVYVALGLLLKFRYLKKKLFLVAIVCSFISFINVSFSSFGNFDYYKKFIMFSTAILWIVYCSSLKIKKQTINIINIINVLIAFVYIYAFRIGFDMIEGEMLLTLNFPNPNQTGVFLLNTILYLTLVVISGKNLSYNMIFKCFCLLVVISLLVLLFFTGCRSALGAYIVFFLLCIIEKLHFRFLHGKWFYIIWAIAPLIFVHIYMQLINVIDIDFSFGMDISNKSSSTRFSVWKDSINMISENFLLGDYSNVERFIKYSHAHNTHLDVWICYGILPLLLFIYILYKSTWCTNLRASTSFQRYSLYAFLVCFVNGFFEATLISGSAGLFLLSFGFLLLANAELDNCNKFRMFLRN